MSDEPSASDPSSAPAEPSSAESGGEPPSDEQVGGHQHVDLEPPSPELIARRKTLSMVCLGLGGCIGVALAVPVAGFVVAPLFRDTPHTWRAVGAVSSFKIGETVAVTFIDASPLKWAGITARTAAWLRRVSEEQFIAYSVNCAHLGCPVRWLPDAQLFMCPCHGGVYYADGSVAAGPPPHALTQYPVRIQGGAVEIHTEPIPV